MIRLITVPLLVVVVPGVASAGFFGFGDKPVSHIETYDQYQEKKKIPRWKQRLYERYGIEWDKPGGGNFPIPVKAPDGVKPPPQSTPVDPSKAKAEPRSFAPAQKLIQQPSMKVNKSEGKPPTERWKEQQTALTTQTSQQSVWARMRNAWRVRWQNRQITADQHSGLENQAGLGIGIRRAGSQTVYSWRNRFDTRRQGIKPPKARRRRPGYKPPRAPAVRHRVMHKGVDPRARRIKSQKRPKPANRPKPPLQPKPPPHYTTPPGWR